MSPAPARRARAAVGAPAADPSRPPVVDALPGVRQAHLGEDRHHPLTAPPSGRSRATVSRRCGCGRRRTPARRPRPTGSRPTCSPASQVSSAMSTTPTSRASTCQVAPLVSQRRTALEVLAHGRRRSVSPRRRRCPRCPHRGQPRLRRRRRAVASPPSAVDAVRSAAPARQCPRRPAARWPATGSGCAAAGPPARGRPVRGASPHARPPRLRPAGGRPTTGPPRGRRCARRGAAGPAGLAEVLDLLGVQAGAGALRRAAARR